MTSKSSDVKWKERLLSSGLPLEHILAKKLEDLDVHIVGEYDYLRLNKESERKSFSIDLHVIAKIRDVIFNDILLECKYKKPGTKWVFIPRRTKDMYVPRSLYSPYDYFNDKFHFDKLSLSILSYEDIATAIKGTEIFDSHENSSSIKEGINQLKYGLLDCYINLAKDQLMSWSQSTVDSAPIYLRLLSGILVTTAEIWVLNEEVDLKDIHNSRNIEDIAVQKNFIYLRDLPSKEYEEYCKSSIIESISSFKTGIPEWDEGIEIILSDNFSETGEIENLSNFSISQLAVCHIDHINDFLTMHIKKISDNMGSILTKYE